MGSTGDRSKGRAWAASLIVLATALSIVAVVLQLRLDPNVASLLPERGEAAALRQYLRAFGGTDLGVVLVRGPSEPEVSAVAEQLATELEQSPTVELATAGIEVEQALDPMLVWRHADARARARLAAALSPEGMRARLRESRAMLLAPGSGAASEVIASDPLRLAQLLVDSTAIRSGVKTQADGAFATDDGRVRLVLVRPQGQALRGEDAKAFVTDARRVIDAQRAEHPAVEIGLTGGHAIAEATERMIVRDMSVTGTAAMLLAALAFALTFRRMRALIAVMPPLVLGTLWTAAIAAMLPSGLSAIAVGFMSVVVGVGMDTGVHVYAALLEARREGLAPVDAARVARQRTQRPVLVAAVTAAAAFGALGLSDIGALRQLGILCAGGELLTAVAIVVITPEIGAWLERGAPPAARPPWWTGAVASLTSTRRRAAAFIALALVPIVAVALGYGPGLSESIVALRPAGLEPLQVQKQVYEAFGGRSGQWVVLVADDEGEQARTRADRIAEALAEAGDDVDTVDALTALVPALQTQEERFRARDALDLPSKADELERALGDVGFAAERFTDALDHMRDPPTDIIGLDSVQGSAGAILLLRYLASDPAEAMVALYVHPRDDDGARGRVESLIRQVDAEAMITGYGRLETSLRSTLAEDLPKVGAVAFLLVLLALGAALRRARDVGLALLVVVAEIAAVLLLIRALDVPLHAYDALVLPVLLGITVDEGMFLLFRARRSARAAPDADPVRWTLQHEGPPVATTALTTAAGFGALAWCDFDGLRHLGIVGALGSLVGLVVAVVLVPAGLRLTRTAG